VFYVTASLDDTYVQMVTNKVVNIRNMMRNTLLPVTETHKKHNWNKTEWQRRTQNSCNSSFSHSIRHCISGKKVASD